jgi:crotonobetainyl-CoA:carnitine CoA-transferase CaiB-like acyl-CoA transferase
MLNSHKKGIVIDLKTVEGQQIFHQLLATADIFLTNNRADALKKLQLDYDTLKAKYPNLIFAWVTGFGEKGPDAAQPGYDVVAFWARSGFLADLAQPGGYPVTSPAGVGDQTVGMSLFAGICAALLKRERTGKGEKITVSLYGSAIWFAGAIIVSVQDRYGNIYPRDKNFMNPLASPFICKDGEWLMLSILEYDRYYASFCKAIGREDIVDDERFNKRDNMMKNKPALVKIMEETFKTKTREEWIAILRAADIVHDKLRHFKDVLTDEQAWANNYLHNITFANGGQAVLPCPPIQAAEDAPLPYGKAPLLGEHTREVLREMGYVEGKIEELCAKKVVNAK